MTRHRRTTHLKGKDFEPPRRPDILTRSLVVAFNDRRYGAQKGKADAVGHGMSDADGVPHAERLIDAQAERAVEDQRHGFRYPVENAEKVRQDAIEEYADAGREVAGLGERNTELAEQEAALGQRHGPGGVAYSLILAALFCLTLPIDYGAAMWMPVPPLGQWMLTVFIGVAMVLGAHQAAKKVEDLQESHGRRKEDRFGYRKDQAALAAALAVSLGTIVGTTIWRGAVLASDAQMTGGPVHSTAANLALGLLALLAFVVAVLAGMGYRTMQPLREIRKQRAELARERQGWQAVMDRSERTQRQAEVTIAFLEEREAHVVAAIGHWARERKARLRQRASWVSMREQKKAANTVPGSLVGGEASRVAVDRMGEQLRLLPQSVDGHEHANGTR
jgi:hypothetical protein